MKRMIAALLLSASPALAFDITSMDAAEKDAFGAAVREYLMENPQVMIESINALEQRRAAEAAQDDTQLVESNKAALFDDGHSWVGGNPEGDLTIVEFLDYRCGYCRKFNDEVHDVVAKDGNIRLIIKEFPILGEDSANSARFTVAVKQVAGDEAYYKAHEAMMEMREPATTEAFRDIAKDIGVDADKVIEAMDTDSVSEVLRSNHELAQKMAIQGTPTFVVGTELLRGVPQAGLASVVKSVRDAEAG